MKRTVKRILSCVLAAATVSAFAAFPALADYTACGYDIEREHITYDDGNTTNDIDGSPALQVGGSGEYDVNTGLDDRTNMFKFPSSGGNCEMMTNDFFLSFDFRFDTIDGAVPGVIGIDRIDDNGRNEKTGPKLTYSGGQIRNETGSNKFEYIGNISPDTWYTVELEGKMVVDDAAVEFRLYSYENGTKTLISSEPNLNLRQFYAGSNNGRPNLLYAASASIDNVIFISEYPDEIRVLSGTSEVDAGQAITLDYAMYRIDKPMTKHPVEWSVYDEANENEITDGSVTINDSGVLRADINSPDQTVTVRATTNVSGQELTGTYQVAVNAVSTEEEPFDSIVINGPSSVKAGTSTQYSFTAMKNGEDVTASIEDSDVVWSIYTPDDLFENKNIKITAENGLLAVDDSVIAQNIILRASTHSGAVYTAYPVAIEFSDNQSETILGSNACETDMGLTERADSWDGSYAYRATGAFNVVTFERRSDYVLTALDIKFEQADSGFTLKQVSGNKSNPCVRFHDGSLSLQTGGSKWDSLMEINSDTWYHIEILYSHNESNASLTIAPYNADGTLGETSRFLAVNTRNNEAYDGLQIEGGTVVDNVKIVVPEADNIQLSAESNSMFAGSDNQITANASRNGLPLLNYTGLTWSVLDSEDLPIIDGSITINQMGLLTVDTMAPEQTVNVVASSGDVSASIPITIQSSEVFKVTNLGLNEDKTKIVKMYVDKDFYYNDSVTFIIAVYSPDGILKGVSFRSGYGDNYVIGSNEVNFDFTLPDDFDPATDTISTFVWTSLN